MEDLPACCAAGDPYCCLPQRPLEPEPSCGWAPWRSQVKANRPNRSDFQQADLGRSPAEAPPLHGAVLPAGRFLTSARKHTFPGRPSKGKQSCRMSLSHGRPILLISTSCHSPILVPFSSCPDSQDELSPLPSFLPLARDPRGCPASSWKMQFLENSSWLSKGLVPGQS